MRMSCNGCRVLRKGCTEDCSIRPCLQWIDSPESQANATVFLAKFYGRAGLMNLINAGPESPDHLLPAVFRSLLYEACGRIVNPINGSVGLLWSGNWQLCQNAVEAVLRGDPITQVIQKEQNNEFNKAQPVNETYTFQPHPNVVSDWEALKEALTHQDRVAVENKGKVSFNNRTLHVIGDTRSPYEEAMSIIGKTLAHFDEDNLIPCFGFGDATTHDPEVFRFYRDRSPCHGFEEVLDCYRRMAPNMKLSGDEVIKELPVQDAGYAMNAESQPSHFLTKKSPPLQEIIELEKDLVVLDHSHQLPVVEDSIHKKGLVVGAEKYDSYIHVLDKTCIEETSKEESSPEKGYSYDILSAHFGKLQDDAAKYFNVSRSTFKRICRDNGIKRWRSHKKKLDSQRSSELRRVNDEEPE